MTGAARLSRGVRPAWRAAGKESPGASCAFWAASLGRQSGAISHLAQRREVKPTASISLKKKRKRKKTKVPVTRLLPKPGAVPSCDSQAPVFLSGGAQARTPGPVRRISRPSQEAARVQKTACPCPGSEHLGFVRHLLHGSHSRGSLGWKHPDPLCNPLQKQGFGVGALPGGVCSELQREGFGTWLLNSLGQKSGPVSFCPVTLPGSQRVPLGLG